MIGAPNSAICTATVSIRRLDVSRTARTNLSVQCRVLGQRAARCAPSARQTSSIPHREQARLRHEVRHEPVQFDDPSDEEAGTPAVGGVEGLPRVAPPPPLLPQLDRRQSQQPPRSSPDASPLPRIRGAACDHWKWSTDDRPDRARQGGLSAGVPDGPDWSLSAGDQPVGLRSSRSARAGVVRPVRR